MTVAFHSPVTALQAAIVARIADRRLPVVAIEADLHPSVISKARAGRWTPFDGVIAQRLALWLGWTVTRVLEAAKTPADRCAACGQVVAESKLAGRAELVSPTAPRPLEVLAFPLAVAASGAHDIMRLDQPILDRLRREGEALTRQIRKTEERAALLKNTVLRAVDSLDATWAELPIDPEKPCL